jgi:pentatricopeptide repeat domain-containing protein 1
MPADTCCLDQLEQFLAGAMQEMAERGIERNVHTFSALMNVCIKCGQYRRALDVYRDMQAAVRLLLPSLLWKALSGAC